MRHPNEKANRRDSSIIMNKLFKWCQKLQEIRTSASMPSKYLSTTIIQLAKSTFHKDTSSRQSQIEYRDYNERITLHVIVWWNWHKLHDE